MPIKELMNWVPAEKRWRVHKDKRAYWFNPATHGLPATKEGSVRGANEYWEKKEAELEQAKTQRWEERRHIEEYAANITELEKILAVQEYLADSESQKLVEVLRIKLAKLKSTYQTEFDLKPLKRSDKSPFQVTFDDTYAAVVESTGESSDDCMVLPDEEDFRRFYETNDDVLSPEQYAIWQDRLSHADKILPVRSSAPAPKDQTVGFFIDRFVSRKVKQCQAEHITIERVDKVRFDLNKFGDWFGRDRLVQEIDLSVIEAYYHWLLEEIMRKKKRKSGSAVPNDGGTFSKDGKILSKDGFSEFFANDLMVILKGFVRDLDEDGIIEAPKKIYNKRAFQIRRPKTTNKTVPIEDIRIILESAEVEERTKLFVLLALNSGMYQKDISSLRQDEVDWLTGRIVRKRTKTRDCDNVPEAGYKLWNQTLTLLKKYRAPESNELVLLNRYGEPLRKIRLVEGETEGETTKSDAITTSWKRALKKVGMKHPFSKLRKTSADLIHNEMKYREFTSLFLCHAPRTIAEIYYCNEGATILDEAIIWLGEKLGVE